MSTIAAGTTSGQALVTTGDSSGNLVLTVNNTTVAVTLNTSGAIGVGTSPSYGTSGQVLTSSGSGAAPTWSAPATVNLTTGVTGTLPIANGGTNSTATPTAGSVVYGTGSALAYTTAGSAGGVLYSTGSTAPAFSAVGTSGQVLTSAGSGAPTWTTPSAGAMTLISTQTVTSANQIVWTGLSTYNKYIVIIDYMIGNSGGSQQPNYYLVVGYGAGPTYRTSNYNYSTIYRISNGYAGYVWTGSTSGAGSAVSLNALSADPTNGAFAGSITLENFLASNAACSVTGLTTYFAGYFNNPTGPVIDVVSGQQLDTGTANTAIKLYIGSGTFNGKASLYGISS